MAFSQSIPQSLKPMQHYMKTACEHDNRDVVVAYYYIGTFGVFGLHGRVIDSRTLPFPFLTYCVGCLKGRLFAFQKSLEIDKKSPEARQFLGSLMDYLENVKREHSYEAIDSEIVGQAHLENYALKVFLFADNEDRASRFNKNVVKSFYTAGMLFDVLTMFDELSEDIENNRKYAKWKAAYIHRCLKSGETPLPGPLPGDKEDVGFDESNLGPSSSHLSDANAEDQSHLGHVSSQQDPYSVESTLPTSDPSLYLPPSSGAHAPPSTPSHSHPPISQDPNLPTPPRPSPRSSPKPSPDVHQNTTWRPPPNPEGITLNAEHYQKAMKFCKYACSAMQYEDSQSAIDNLNSALHILTTGEN